VLALAFPLMALTVIGGAPLAAGAPRSGQPLHPTTEVAAIASTAGPSRDLQGNERFVAATATAATTTATTAATMTAWAYEPDEPHQAQPGLLTERANPDRPRRRAEVGKPGVIAARGGPHRLEAPRGREGGSGTGRAPGPPPPARPVRTYLGTFIVTCYDLTGVTASGAMAGPDSVAVDPTVIPLGTQVYVAGVGQRTADDTGGAIIGDHVDVWEPTYTQCIDWGVQQRAVYRVTADR